MPSGPEMFLKSLLPGLDLNQIQATVQFAANAIKETRESQLRCEAHIKSLIAEQAIMREELAAIHSHVNGHLPAPPDGLDQFTDVSMEPVESEV